MHGVAAAEATGERLVEVLWGRVDTVVKGGVVWKLGGRPVPGNVPPSHP